MPRTKPNASTRTKRPSSPSPVMAPRRPRPPLAEVAAKRILRTGEAARLIGCSPRKLAMLFDEGRLKGYRLPGSLDRRILRTELVAFMQREGLPMELLEGA